MKICSYKELDKEFFQKIEFENIESVEEIIKDVRYRGVEALKEYSLKFDKIERESFKINDKEIEKAFSSVNKQTIDSIDFAAKNIREFAKKQFDSISELKTTIGGNILGHRILPLDSVGCYVPGGNYPLPSTALMTVIPAKVAGVKKVVVCSPKIQPVTIVACKIAGADEIYCLGGVQAVAAMAYGINVPKVCKIVGPGNKFVTAAKKYVYGECGIDFLAGPSEVLIVADDSANPDFVAADMLAQCEHDKDARAYLITFSDEFIEKVKSKAEEFLTKLQTAEIAKVSFEKSIAIKVESINDAIELSNKRAPEHLELCLKNTETVMNNFTNYGSLFIGNYSAEVFGDYASGTNHTLPTNQVARYSGGLSVFNYIKTQTYQIINRQNSDNLIRFSSALAHQEGLEAHALAAEIREHN